MVMKEGIFSPYAFRTQIIVCNCGKPYKGGPPLGFSL